MIPSSDCPRGRLTDPAQAGRNYATQIARDWNVKASGAGFVTRFNVDGYYLSRYRVEKGGGAIHTEYWIPAEDLAEFNRNIHGIIEVIAEFK
jgi:hypothetical protein